MTTAQVIEEMVGLPVSPITVLHSQDYTQDVSPGTEKKIAREWRRWTDKTGWEKKGKKKWEIYFFFSIFLF